MERFRSPDEPGRLVICFDFEGSYGMPHDVPYDLEASTRLILAELARYQAHAVFFVVGRIVEEHPQLVKELAAAGHEIGLHGYNHDNLARYDRQALTRLSDDLARVGSLVQDITGTRPLCFRAPYLLWPHFYRPEIYAMLKDQGYRWVSNREVRYPVELFRPDRILARKAWRRSSTELPRLASSRVMLASLNLHLVARETFGGSPAGRLRWLLGQRGPFMRDGLVEVPISVPLDCDLLGLPTPRADTSPDMLAYARAVVRAAAAARGVLTTLTFHDWIISGGNRLALLGDALAAAHIHGTIVSTVAANPGWLPGPA